MNYGKGDFPITEKAAAEIISLPMFPQLAAEQQARVVDEIKSFAQIASAHKRAAAGIVSLAANERTA
jgi:hypothetical protein